VTTQIIITGPPGSGKSSLVRALKLSGHLILPEIAREVIKTEKKSGRGYFPWSHLAEFSDLVFREFLNRKKDYGTSIVFTDRGVPDTMSYMRLGKLKEPKEYYHELASYPYHKVVFYAPFWNDIYKVDDVRKESVSEAKAVGEAIQDCYTDLGFTLYQLPLGTVAERVRYVEDYIKYHF
jgi:predicted ATPase